MLNPLPFNGQVYSSNLEVATSCSLGTPKLVCLKLVYWCQKQPVLTPATYNMVFFEKLEKVLMGVHNASPIILNKNLCKMFSNNLPNYSSSNAEDNTNDKWGITYLTCLNKIEWWKQKLFFNCDLLYARLNSTYEAGSYKKKKHNKITAYRKSV